MEKDLQDLGLNKEVLVLGLSTETIYKRKNKLDFMKIKNFCSPKDPCEVNEKTSYRVGEKVFANHISDKVLVPRIYKEI